MLEKILRFFEKYIIPESLYKLGQPAYHFILSWTGFIFYRNPSKDIFVVGVTGTKGKTTTVKLMNEIFGIADKKIAMMSSTSISINGEEFNKKSSNTMPGRWEIQRFLRKAVREGCDYAFLEVTSQGVVKHRHRFINWDGAVFLNLHPEHIESHGSYEKYREAKLSFFRYLKNSNKDKKSFFINKDDSEASLFIKEAEKINKKEIILFSSNDVYDLSQDVRKEKSPDWLKADFNLDNLAAAVAVAKSRTINSFDIKKAVARFKGVEGRLEFVQYKPFKVVVDYAHTPDSLEALYKNLKDLDGFSEKSKLICVLGSAGGGRDKWKRPKMGKVAGDYCDKIILTSEDPYKEDPKDIINDIKKGVKSINSKNVSMHEIVDRREALKKAVSLAGEGDVVVSTGMGSQKYFYGPEGKEEWSEVKVVEEILENHINLHK